MNLIIQTLSPKEARMKNETRKDANCWERRNLRWLAKIKVGNCIFYHATILTGEIPPMHWYSSSSGILGATFSARNHTHTHTAQLKFYNAVMKFHDYNQCKMADLVLVAAMETKRPWGVKLMKCGAISKGDSLSMGIILSDSTTKAINNCLAFLWMDDAKKKWLSRKLPRAKHCSLTLVIVHMLPYKLKLHEIPSILTLWFMLCLRWWSER